MILGQTSGSRRAYRAAAALTLMALFLGACGDDSTTTKSTGTGSTATSGSGASGGTAAKATGATATSGSGATGGAAVKATGDPVSIGFINQENDPAGDYSDVHAGVDAAVGRINNELGGLDGRPIKLEVCTTKAASGGDVCANQMVAAKVPVVEGGYVFNSGPMLPILKSAALPYVGGFALTAADFPADDNHAYIGGSTVSSYGALGNYVNSLGVKRVSIIYIDVPAGKAGADALKASVEKSGATVKMIPFPSGAADVTPFVTAAGEGSPGVIAILVAAPACGNVMGAIPTLGLKAKVVTAPACASKEVLDLAGSGATGVQYYSSYKAYNTVGDAEVATYQKAMKDYTSKSISARSVEGYAVTMAVYDILKKSGGAAATTQRVAETLRTAKDVNFVLGVPYTCSPPPVPAVPAVCQDGIRMWEVGADRASVSVANGKIFRTAG